MVQTRSQLAQLAQLLPLAPSTVTQTTVVTQTTTVTSTTTTVTKTSSRRKAKSSFEASKYDDIPGKAEQEFRQVHDAYVQWGKNHPRNFDFYSEYDLPMHAKLGVTIDTLIQTIFSQSTSNEQGQFVVKQLKETYVYKTGNILENGEEETVVGDIPNYHAVYKDGIEKLKKVLHPAGLQNIKTGFVFGLFELVYQENAERLGLADPSIQDNALGKTEFQPGLLDISWLGDMDWQDRYKWLTAIKGVSEKTAACIMAFGYNDPVFPVDTHCLRQCKFLGWLPEGICLASHAAEAMFYLHTKIPDDIKFSTHQAQWNHGKECGVCNGKISPKSKRYTEALAACDLTPYMNRNLVIKERYEVSPKKRKAESSEEETAEEPVVKKFKGETNTKHMIAYNGLNISSEYIMHVGGYKLVEMQARDDNFGLKTRVNLDDRVLRKWVLQTSLSPKAKVVLDPMPWTFKSETVQWGDAGATSFKWKLQRKSSEDSGKEDLKFEVETEVREDAGAMKSECGSEFDA